MNYEASARGGATTLARYGRAHYVRIGSHHRRGNFAERQASRPRPRGGEQQSEQEVQPIRKSVFGPRAKRTNT